MEQLESFRIAPLHDVESRQEEVSTRRQKISATVAGVVLSLGIAPYVAAEAADQGEDARIVAIDSSANESTADLELAAASLSARSRYCMARDRVILVAHRGISEPGGDGTIRVGNRLYTENTVPAIIKGIKLGADASEFDHWRTRDGESVVYHDTTLGRPDVDPNEGGRVDSHSYDNDLERVTLPSGAKMPTNAQVVRSVDRNTREGSLQPELKVTRGTYQQKVEWITGMVTRAQEYLKNNPHADVLFTSGSRGLLDIVNKVSKGTIDTGLINFGARVIPLKNVPRWIDGINNASTTRGLSSRYVKNAHERNIGIGVRSVNTKALFQRLVNRLHIDRVITDKPKAINNGC